MAVVLIIFCVCMCVCVCFYCQKLTSGHGSWLLQLVCSFIENSSNGQLDLISMYSWKTDCLQHNTLICLYLILCGIHAVSGVPVEALRCLMTWQLHLQRNAMRCGWKRRNPSVNWTLWSHLALNIRTYCAERLWEQHRKRHAVVKVCLISCKISWCIIVLFAVHL